MTNSPADKHASHYATTDCSVVFWVLNKCKDSVFLYPLISLSDGREIKAGLDCLSNGAWKIKIKIIRPTS